MRTLNIATKKKILHGMTIACNRPCVLKMHKNRHEKIFQNIILAPVPSSENIA